MESAEDFFADRIICLLKTFDLGLSLGWGLTIFYHNFCKSYKESKLLHIGYSTLKWWKNQNYKDGLGHQRIH